MKGWSFGAIVMAAATLVAVVSAPVIGAGQDAAPEAQAGRAVHGQSDLSGFLGPAGTFGLGLHDIEKGETEEHIKAIGLHLFS